MRTYNFSPGPAALPTEVLEQARDELLDWNGSGMSVMEVSHRGKAFLQVAAEAEADLRELLAVPRNYKVLFVQGGASAQFSVVPLNLAAPKSVTDYINTGHWSKRAIAEARRYCAVNVAGDAGGEYLRVPPQRELKLSTEGAYVHYTPNETISGVKFSCVPQPARCRWWRTCPRPCCPAPSTCPSSGSSMPARRRTSDPLAPDPGDRARGSDRARAPRNPRRVLPTTRRWPDAGLAVEHAADLRLVHCRPGVQMAQEERRALRHGRTQRCQGARTLRRDRRLLVLSQPRGPRMRAPG